jgi:hypothetical protein
MKLYIKNDEIRPINKIVLYKNGQQIFNPTEDLLLEDGWVEYIPIQKEVSQEELINQAKDRIKDDIIAYDQSNNVNTCTIKYLGNSIDYWADKLTRSSLKTTVNDYLESGKKEYRLDIRDFGVSLLIPCEDLLGMLRALEVYAVECYNTTTDHLYAVDKLTSVEEVESYNYKCNYPHKLKFEL